MLSKIAVDVEGGEEILFADGYVALGHADGAEKDKFPISTCGILLVVADDFRQRIVIFASEWYWSEIALKYAVFVEINLVRWEVEKHMTEDEGD